MSWVLVLFLLGSNNYPIEMNLNGYETYHACADAREWFKDHSWIRDKDRTIYHIDHAVCTQERQL